MEEIENIKSDLKILMEISEFVSMAENKFDEEHSNFRF